MGAELEAKGKEWSLKVTEAADTLDDARKQLEVEAQRIRTEAKKREEDLATQLAAARAACPKIAEKLPAPPVPPVATAIAPSQAALAKVARTADGARDAARVIAPIKVPRL